MYLEYCCYNKSPTDSIETEIKSVFYTMASEISGLCLPLYIVRQISSELSLLPSLLVSCPVDYPFGTGDSKVRQHETLVALKSGVNTIDLVMNPFLFKTKSKSSIKKDVVPILKILKEYDADLRIILNYDLYDAEELMCVVKILEDVGVKMIIPSSGFRNDDIFDNLLFCGKVEKETTIKTVCSGRMWLKKHYRAAINSGLFGLRAYSLTNLDDLGVLKE
jgi:deoxyribose-phosphate aldolase|tara:strand:- start:5727 stop:6386 length:660 start_codon:yes stop_codon:yes gene_type:complete